MELNTKIGRRIRYNDVYVDKLKNYMPIISFVRLGDKNYLYNNDAYNYVYHRAVEIIRSHGDFDPDLANGILSGRIQGKKCYIPVYCATGNYTFDRQKGFKHYRWEDGSVDKKKHLMNEHVGTYNVDEGANITEWYVPSDFDGLIREKSFHSLRYSLSTLCNQSVNSFNEKELCFFNHQNVLKTKNGVQDFIAAKAKYEFKHGVYAKKNPRNLKLEYQVYLFEILVFEFSNGSNTPAYIAINVFDPTCYTYRKKQGLSNPDYTGRLNTSYNNNQASRPFQQTQTTPINNEHKAKAMDLVYNQVSTPKKTPEQIEEERRRDQAFNERNVERRKQLDRERLCDSIMAKHNKYKRIFYVVYFLIILMTLIISKFSNFFVAILLFGLILVARIIITKKFGIEKRKYIPDLLTKHNEDVKKVLKTDVLLLVFGIIASIIAMLIIIII